VSALIRQIREIKFENKESEEDHKESEEELKAREEDLKLNNVLHLGMKSRYK
jgi:hypothetical protein